MVLVSLDFLISGAISGRVISFPTDTVPALASKPDRSEEIFITKQRRADKPLILMGASAGDLWPFCRGTPAELAIWQQVADKYWPGALTLVLPASANVPRAMNPLDPTTIGVRVPDSAIARQILARTGPLATTSANLSGQPPLTTMAAVDAQFPDVPALFPSNIETPTPASGVPSTVAKWRGDRWEILRQGAIEIR